MKGRWRGGGDDGEGRGGERRWIDGEKGGWWEEIGGEERRVAGFTLYQYIKQATKHIYTRNLIGLG